MCLKIFFIADSLIRLECAIHPITYRGEGILATVVKVNTTTVYRYLDKLCAEHVVIKYPDLNSDKAMFQFAGEEKKMYRPPASEIYQMRQGCTS